MADRRRKSQDIRIDRPQWRNLRKSTIRKIEEQKRERDQARRKRWTVARWVLGVIALAFLAYGAYLTYSNLRKYEEAEAVVENSAVAGFSSYIDVDDGVIAYGSSGMCLFSTEGNILWRISYTMSNPKAVVNGSCGAIADMNHRDVIIFGSSGVTGRVTLDDPVLNLAVSSFGVLAVAQDKGTGGEIRFFRPDGTPLDIRIGTTIAVSGYPLEMAMSPSGQRLAVAGTIPGQGVLQTRLRLYDLSDSQAEETDKAIDFVFGNTIFPSMTYLTEDRLCAFGDDRVCIFTYASDGKPSCTLEDEISQEIIRVMAASGRVGILLRQPGSGEMIFRQYNASGRRTFEKIVPSSYDMARYSGKYAVFTNSGRIRVMTAWGRLRYEGDLGDASTWIRFTKDDTFLQFSQEKIKEFKLS